MGIKRIVIIGGGFAGIELINGLGGNRFYQITLIDVNNYYFFPPLLYQVAAGFLDTASISYPFRRMIRNKHNIKFQLGKLTGIDPQNRICSLEDGEISYDYLVIATGAKPNYYGLENIMRYAIPMKNIRNALQMRNTLLENLEKATMLGDTSGRKKLLSVVVAGGGPTGVEVSGMLAELRKYVLRKDYPELLGASNNIVIIDSNPRLLVTLSEKSGTDAFSYLHKLGVRIILNASVKDFDGSEVVLSNGETIEAATLIWTAGITAKSFDGIPEKCIGAGNRMIANPYNQLVGFDDIFVVGDTCLQQHDPFYPRGHPQLAQTAIQHGKLLGRNFKALAKGKDMQPFKYSDKGVMAIVGRNQAVVDIPSPKLHLRGFLALLIWLFIHIMRLVNYRNKLRTLFNWTAAYINRDQSLRMIIRPSGNPD